MRTQELNPAAVAGDISEPEICATHETRPLNPQTVAVLPFHNQSADAEQEFSATGSPTTSLTRLAVFQV
jgi:TolB-like protein